MRTLLSKRAISRIVYILVGAAILSIVFTSALQYIESTQFETLTPTTTLTVFANKTTFSPPFKGLVKKGYFNSLGEVYVCMSSQYAHYWETFNVWMSLDNYSWVAVPFLESASNNPTEMAYLGPIDLGNPQLTIYLKSYIPPQTISLPPNVTQQDIENIKSSVIVKLQATPADTTQLILSFFTIFEVILGIISLETQKEKKEKRRRRKKK